MRPESWCAYVTALLIPRASSPEPPGGLHAAAGSTEDAACGCTLRHERLAPRSVRYSQLCEALLPEQHDLAAVPPKSGDGRLAG